jgi:hypothetical protein
MVDVAVEGDLDEVVLRTVLASLGIEAGRVFGRRGKHQLKENVKRYNLAARYGRWVTLVDLNHDAECAPPFVSSWLPDRHPNLQLRVAVRAIEAWLLADRAEIALFLGVPEQRIPARPEEEPDPKAAVICIARRSRSRTIREDIVPRPDSAARQGPGYTTRLIEFTMRRWDPRRAARRAPSLERTLSSLSRWKASSNE